MPEFIPILAAAVILLTVLFVAFGLGGTQTFESARRILIGSDFTVSQIATQNKIGELSGTVSSGILTGAKRAFYFELDRLDDVENAEIKMNITNTNLYGTFIVNLNGKQVYSAYPRIGVHTISLGKDSLDNQNNLEIKAGSSGWRFWAPTIYEFDSDIFINIQGLQKKEYTFSLARSELSPKSANLVIQGLKLRGRDMIVNLNNVEI